MPLHGSAVLLLRWALWHCVLAEAAHYGSGSAVGGSATLLFVRWKRLERGRLGFVHRVGSSAVSSARVALDHKKPDMY